jgi:aldehyde reductase
MPPGIFKVKLNNGLEMPVLGLSTGQYVSENKKEIYDFITDAIDLGYRLFDCTYGSEEAIGDAIREKIIQGVVHRKDLFLVTKFECNSHGPALQLVESTLTATLKKLQTTYLDLCIIRCPVATEKGAKLEDSESDQYCDIVEMWNAMEILCMKHLIKAIGVSTLSREQIDRILNKCTKPPQVNHVECHPFLNQSELRKYCEDKGIVVIHYCPLEESRNTDNCDGADVINDSRIKEIAGRYRKTPEQILIKYSLQLGNVVIPKKKNLMENMNVSDFWLAPEDMSYMNSFSCNESR